MERGPMEVARTSFDVVGACNHLIARELGVAEKQKSKPPELGFSWG